MRGMAPDTSLHGNITQNTMTTVITMKTSRQGKVPVLNKVSRHQDIKVKVKLPLCFEHHTMKAYWGSGGIAPLIL
jgi:hypothetical protein